MTNKLIIHGSPRARGRSSYVAENLKRKAWTENPSDIVEVFSVAPNDIQPCFACDLCKFNYHCAINDDMQKLYPLLDNADEILVVSPVFFAGPPSQLKALYDRFQPYYWRTVKGDRIRSEKRFVSLYIVGEGHDPHGFEPLIGITRSAFGVLGFELDEIYDFVGLDGEELVTAVAEAGDHRYHSAIPNKKSTKQAERTDTKNSRKPEAHNGEAKGYE